MGKKMMYLVCFALVFCLYACNNQKEEDYATTVDQFDYSNTNAITKVIDAQYDYAGAFYDGYAVIGKKIDGRMQYNFIDKEEKLLSSTWYDYADGFSEGLAAVGKRSENDHLLKDSIGLTDMLYGYIDTKGKVVIPLQWKSALEHYQPGAFYHGYAEIAQFDTEAIDYTYPDGQFTFNMMDRKGNLLFDVWCTGSGYSKARELVYPYSLSLSAIRPLTDYASYHPWQHHLVYQETGNTLLCNQPQRKAVLLDENGEEIAIVKDCYEIRENAYNDCLIYTTLSVEKEEAVYHYGLLDASGTVLISPVYDALSFLNAEYLSASTAEGNGILNRTGAIVAPFGNYSYELADDVILRSEFIASTGETKSTVWNLDGSLRADLGNGASCFILRPERYEIDDSFTSSKNPGYIVRYTYSESKDKKFSILYDYDGKEIMTTDCWVSYQQGFLIGYAPSQHNLHCTVWKDTELLFEIPDLYNIHSLRENLFVGFSYHYDASVNQEYSAYHVYQILEENGTYRYEEIALLDSVTAYALYRDNMKQEGRTVENAESKLILDPQNATFQLYDSKNNQIAIAPQRTLFSLLEHGFYLSADFTGEFPEHTESISYNDISGYVLHNRDDSLDSSRFEYLGQLWDGYLVYRQDGKYGYLKLDSK